MLPVTPNLAESIEVSQVTPAMVMKIDGVATVFTSIKIEKYIRIGDPLLFIGDTWTIGGFSLVEDQSDYVSFNTGTTTKITQKLDVLRARGASVSSMVVSLVDKNEEITELASPSVVLPDLMGRDVTIYSGIKDTAWPEDYNVIFQGVIKDLDSGAGYLSLILSNTEEKKRSQVLTRTTDALDGGISNVDTSVLLVDATDFVTPADALSTYVKIQDEFIGYTGKSTNTLTGLTRAQLGTLAAAHADEQEVEQWCKLTGHGLELALKLMLSRGATNYITALPSRGIEVFDITYSIPNAIFFNQINIEQEYGVSVGDTIIISGATVPANNQTTTIAEIGLIDDSSYVIVDGTLFSENPTTAVASFQSKWNVLPIGLGMKPKEVDVKQHLYLRDTFLPVFQLELYFNESTDTKAFIETELYLPLACFSVPRKGRSSVIYHVAPLPTSDVKTLDADTVKNASSLKLQRSTTENFFNQVDYSFDFDPLTEKLKTVKSYESTDSKTRIPLGDRPLTIESQGLRSTLDGAIRTRQSAARFLRRYQFGAEFIKGVDVQFKTGYAIEIGDIVLVDFDSLQLSNFDKGYRGGGFKLMECLNKTLDQKTGEIKLDIVNTAYGVGDRFGLISPSSIVTTGSTTTKLKIKKSYTTKAFQRESLKWTNYVGQEVIVHSEDWATSYTTTIKGFDNLDPQGMLIDAIPTAPLAGWVIQCPLYPSTLIQNDLAFWKLRHAFFSPQVAVTASVGGFLQTKFTVSPSDIGKFFVGSQVRIHTYDYTDDAPEAKVVSIVGNDVEIDTASGFTIGITHLVDLVGFPDLQNAYRVL